MVHAGHRGGLDANVLSAYCQYAIKMEDLNASITSVYWCMFHKPLPHAEGGCKYEESTWCQRKRTYDYITWEAAQVEAGDAVVEYDETSPLERENHAADMSGAAGTFADRFKDANEDPYADVDMFLCDSE
jgi:hypothetical protein